jgi:hypothetical protein
VPYNLSRSPSGKQPASLLARLSGHLRRGTLGERLWTRLGRTSERFRVRWLGAESVQQAVRALADWGRLVLADGPPEGWLLSLGDGGDYHERLNGRLASLHLPFKAYSLENVLAWDEPRIRDLQGIICGYADARRMTHAVRALATHPVLSRIPFEYAAGLDREKQMFALRDEYADTYFVAPALLDSPTPYELYEESLQHFEQKCGLRDYLDLYQVIRYVVESRVPGDIAEFGSYRGHSGYLIARTLAALGSDKRLYMFDTFESFPEEPYGMDHFWSRSHHVDFDDVRCKFQRFPRVELVKGDFTQTLPPSGLTGLALAYIDCDSYRATRFLIDELWGARLSERGVLVCEDYGHPALLGNRAAVHEELDGRTGGFRFFSQFSGLYIALKF